MKCPEEVTLSREDGEALRQRLAGDALTADDRRVLDQVLQWYFWLLFALQEATFSLKRLRVMLFGEKPKASGAVRLRVIGTAGGGTGDGRVPPSSGGARRRQAEDHRSQRAAGGPAQAMAVRAPRHIRGRSASTAAMRPWRQASAVRSVAVGACIRSAPGVEIRHRWPCAAVGGALCAGEVPVLGLWPGVHGRRFPRRRRGEI